jgi:hypothetical protein
MTQMSIEGALPCPFCGHQNIKEYAQHKAYTINPPKYKYRLACAKCHADCGNSTTPEGALIKWNTRA